MRRNGSAGGARRGTYDAQERACLLLDTRAAEFAALEANARLEQMVDQHQNQQKADEAEAGAMQAALQARLGAAETEANAARDMAIRTAKH